MEIGVSSKRNASLALELSWMHLGIILELSQNYRGGMGHQLLSQTSRHSRRSQDDRSSEQTPSNECMIRFMAIGRCGFMPLQGDFWENTSLLSITPGWISAENLWGRMLFLQQIVQYPRENQPHPASPLVAEMLRNPAKLVASMCETHLALATGRAACVQSCDDGFSV